MSKIGRTCLLSDTSLRNRTQMLVFHLLGFCPFLFPLLPSVSKSSLCIYASKVSVREYYCFFFSCQLFKRPPIPVSVPRFPLFRSPLSYLRRASLSSAVGGPSAGETGQADGGVRSIWPTHLPLLLWTSWVSGGFCTRPSVQLIFGDCVRPEKVKFFAEICSRWLLASG